MAEQGASQLAGKIEFFSHHAVELFAQLTRSVDFLARIDYLRQPVCGILVGFGVLAELGMLACYFEFVCS
jgi:hypothetical protein